MSAAVANETGRSESEPALSRSDVCVPDERLVRDINDLVLTRLSKLGFDLASTSTMLHGSARFKTLEALGELDATVHELRRLLFGIVDQPALDGNLATALRHVVTDAALRVGCEPQLSIVGDPSRLTPAAAHHVRAVVTEAVHNAIAHARASSVVVAVTIGEDRLEVRVSDDGIGPPEAATHGLGLGSMAARARDLGGTFLFAPSSPRGTLVRWTIPLDD